MISTKIIIIAKPKAITENGINSRIFSFLKISKFEIEVIKEIQFNPIQETIKTMNSGLKYPKYFKKNSGFEILTNNVITRRVIISSKKGKRAV